MQRVLLVAALQVAVLCIAVLHIAGCTERTNADPAPTPSSSPTAPGPVPVVPVPSSNPTVALASPPASSPSATAMPPVLTPSVAPPPVAGSAGAPADLPEGPLPTGGAAGADAGTPVAGSPAAGSPPVAMDAAAPPVEDPGPAELPDPGPEGNGDFEVSSGAPNQPELDDRGAPKGRTFRFTMPLSESTLFDGKDPTLSPNKPVNEDRGISVYVPARYEDGTPAPVLVIQDGDGPLGMIQNALDNLTTSEDPDRKLPAFVAVAVQNGGNDAQGSERGLEYDTLSDRYARFIDEEVLPAVEANPALREAYPNFSFTKNPSGRGALGCSSGGAAAFTMAWFRPDLFARVVAYSTTLVDQQNHEAPEAALYPHGAWDYHSELELIANAERKPLRIFLNVNENDLGASDPESTLHNWVMANERTAAALAAKGYPYRYVHGLGAGHCDLGVQRRTLADALVWVWRGYEGE